MEDFSLLTLRFVAVGVVFFNMIPHFSGLSMSRRKITRIIAAAIVVFDIFASIHIFLHGFLFDVEYWIIQSYLVSKVVVLLFKVSGYHRPQYYYNWMLFVAYIIVYCTNGIILIIADVPNRLNKIAPLFIGVLAYVFIKKGLETIETLKNAEEN